MSRTAVELRVSVPALQWRLVNLGFLAKAEATAMAAAGRPVNARTPHPLPFSQRFVARVAGAIEAGRLSLRRAAGLLDRSTTEMAEMCAAHGHPLTSYDLPG